MRIPTSRLAWGAALALSVAVVAALVARTDWLRKGSERGPVSARAIAAAELTPFQQAALKVEAERGEPTGREAKINIPAELKHYSDRKRFLAVQVAEWQKHRFQTPHDYSELAELIRKGELVELPTLGDAYILYGVGLSADDELFTHYDKKTGDRVTLYADDAALRQEYERIDAAIEESDKAIAGLREEFDATDKRDRAARRSLQTQIAENQKTIAAHRKRKALLQSFYGVEARRRLLASEYAELSRLAENFSGRAYNFENPASRKEFKVRLLSHLRPQALKVLEEIANSYAQKFDRPLPVTSLTRPDEYQNLLGRVNPNATRIETPPHSTGLAFDIYNRYMTAEEQNYLMSELARLKDEGRIEVLRERRDHFHVFAFADGQPPGEKLVRQALDGRAEKTESADAPASGKRTRGEKSEVGKKAGRKKS